ncbi:4-alpha-glucanotransferase [Edaphobacter modestus]|uniref:4-alpha-glucanotransferase n=1 Tax=Edaphobacter modestus TaxID=388466 RepID=A0A4Q7YQW4_9BACT|nr:4-alpha-glucanotransferase [Edaphobacter modestus]RZU39195.1 4-alpha-glucanotransferase [Edaphobacter modestus]
MSGEVINEQRLSGVLLHVTSLPSYGGIGDFGPAAYAFVDFLVQAKQRLWQVLPLSPTGYGSSPYSALSAFAGNPLLISLEKLAEDGWLSRERIAGLAGHDGAVDFDRAVLEKIPLIVEAADNFLQHAPEQARERFQQFSQRNISWLADYAMFSVLRRRFDFAAWNHWPEEFAHRRDDAMSETLNTYGHQLAIEQVIQFFFDEQWCALRKYCAEREIRILGDVAIFVSYDSADVWTNPEVFDLDDELRPLRVSGVPPDYFSVTGQRWGNPLYKWQALAERSFDWWVARIRRSLTLYDMIRLDHFRGFEACWSIPAEEETAVNGVWVKAPGVELFKHLKNVFGELPFIAEDLGLITPEVDELREQFQMPGMRVLQFGFSDRGSHLHLPHSFVPNTVVYTGTHDNNTTLGWWTDDISELERRHLQTYLQPIRHDGDVVWALMRAAARSVANICIFPLQDVLHLGSEARMNIPSASNGNWSWRYQSDALHPDFAVQLADLMEMTDRDGYVPPKPEPVPIVSHTAEAAQNV